MLAELLVEGVSAVVGAVLDTAFGTDGDDEAEPGSEDEAGGDTDRSRT